MGGHSHLWHSHINSLPHHFAYSFSVVVGTADISCVFSKHDAIQFMSLRKKTYTRRQGDRITGSTREALMLSVTKLEASCKWSDVNRKWLSVPLVFRHTNKSVVLLFGCFWDGWDGLMKQGGACIAGNCKWKEWLFRRGANWEWLGRKREYTM